MNEYSNKTAAYLTPCSAVKGQRHCNKKGRHLWHRAHWKDNKTGDSITSYWIG